MIKPARLMLVVILFFGTAMAQEFSLVDSWEAQWRSGNAAAILLEAKERLNKDESDLAGLLLKYQYAVTFLDLEELDLAIAGLLRHGNRVQTEHFSALFPRLQITLLSIREASKKIPSDELIRERKRATSKNKNLAIREYLEALALDGLIEHKYR